MNLQDEERKIMEEQLLSPQLTTQITWQDFSKNRLTRMPKHLKRRFQKRWLNRQVAIQMKAWRKERDRCNKYLFSRKLDSFAF